MKRISNWLRTAAAETRVTVLILLLGGAVALFVFGRPDAPVRGSARGAGLIGVQFAGTEDSAGWSIAAYGRDNLWSGYWWHAGFLVCLSLGLAVLARWGGRNYRTVSTRRLSRPLAWAAIGALALAAIGHLLLWLGLDRRVDGVWPFVAVTTWGTWLIFVLVAAYGVGGVLSRLLRGAVLDVLREADDDDRGDAPTAKHTTTRRRAGSAWRSPVAASARRRSRSGRCRGWNATDGWAGTPPTTSPRCPAARTWPAPGAWPAARPAARHPSPIRRLTRRPSWPPNEARTRPWEAVADSYGAEERHLRANLGYLLSNTPRGSGDDTIARTVNPAESARRQRVPAAVATVLTGMLVNAAVFLVMLWLLSQLLGIFYRWYFGLGGGLPLPRLAARRRGAAARPRRRVHGDVRPARLADPGLAGRRPRLGARLGGGRQGHRGHRRPVTARLAAGPEVPRVRRGGPRRRARGPARAAAVPAARPLGPGRGQRPRHERGGRRRRDRVGAEPCSGCCAVRWRRWRRCWAGCCSRSCSPTSSASGRSGR